MNTEGTGLKSIKVIITAFCAAIAVSLLIALIIPSFDSASKNGAAMPFNDGWYTIDEDGSRIPFTAFGKTTNENEVALYHDHDDALNTINALGLYNYYSAVEVYAGSKQIYSYGNMDDIRNHVNLGNYYSIVDIHRHEMDESAIKVVFLNDKPQTIYGFTGGKGGALEMAMVREYVLTLMTPLASVVFLVMTIFMKARKATRDLITPTHRWLLIFTMTISAWELFDSQILMDMGLNAGDVCLLSFEVYMLLPVPLLMFSFYSCRKLRKCTVWVSSLVFINFIVLNILNFTHRVEFLYSLTSTHAVVFISLVFCLAQITLEFQSRHDLRTGMLFGGYAAFIVSVLIQYLWFFADPSGGNARVLQVGTLVFLLLQFVTIIYSVTQRSDRIVRRLEAQTRFLKTKFKSLVPDDIIQQRLDNEEKIVHTGELKYLTVLESDIRGFSQLTQDMNAEDVIHMLNHYLESMTRVLARQGGYCLEFVGDAIVALFDEEHAGRKHAEKAVIAAVQMQYIMKDINEWNVARGYPTFDMGIGVHSGKTYVGYIGSEERMEYDAIGTTMNLVSRIEGYSTGGQILISAECRKNIEAELIISKSFAIHPKGYKDGVDVFQIAGLGEPYNIRNSTVEVATGALEKPVPITYNMIFNKGVGGNFYEGLIYEASSTNAMMTTGHTLELYDNLKFNYKKDFTCKVVSKSERGVLLRFTSTPPDFASDDQNGR